MLVAMFVWALVNLTQGVAPAEAYWLFLVAAFVFGPAIPMYFASRRAILQSVVPPEMQGRVFALTGSLSQAAGPLGLALLGPVADVVGVQALFVAGGGVVLLVATWWVLSPAVRNLDDGPPVREEAASARVSVRLT
jgi:DHA3 family macrolide efflux protein-like MFS transporter